MILVIYRSPLFILPSVIKHCLIFWGLDTLQFFYINTRSFSIKEGVWADRCRWKMVACSQPHAATALLLADQCIISRQSQALFRHWERSLEDGGQVSSFCQASCRDSGLADGDQVASWDWFCWQTSLVLLQMPYISNSLPNSLMPAMSFFSIYSVSRPCSKVAESR